MSQIRNSTFDNIKLSMIFLVVFGHLIEPVINQSFVIKTIYMSIYSFHMPVFIILSGMLTKLDTSEERIRKNITSLILPLLIFTILYEALNLILEGEISHYSLELQPYWILWFLLSLFIWKSILPIILQLKYPLTLSIIMSLGIGYFEEIGYLLGLSRTIYFFPFFILGYKLGKAYSSNTYLIRIPKVVYILILALNIMLFWLLRDFSHQWLYGSFSYSRLLNDNIDGHLVRAALYLISFLTSMSILMLIPSRTSIISTLGKNSLYVYLWHGFFVKLAIYFGVIDKLINISSMITLVSIFIISVILTLLLSSNFVAKFTRSFLFEPLQKALLKKIKSA